MPPQPTEITTPIDESRRDPGSPGRSPRPAATPGTWPSSRHHSNEPGRQSALLARPSRAAVGRRRARRDDLICEITRLAAEIAQYAVSSRRRARGDSPATPAVRHRAVEVHALSPTARFGRLAGAVRYWTIVTGSDQVVTGSRRRPGGLPTELWLLVGQHRQQALLAALVAVGMLMVMLPTTGQPDVQEVSAAERRAAAESAAKRDRAEPPTTKPADTRAAQRDTTPTRPAQPASPAAKISAPLVPTPSASAESVLPPAGRGAAGPPDTSRQRRGSGPAGSVHWTGSTTVALTFDDGPDPVQTPKLLDLLDKHSVTATFCVVGVRAQAHPELVRRIVADGHALCNHSWDHSFTLGKDKTEKITADLERTNQAIRAAVPDAAIAYFRAPGGNFTNRLVAAADTLGMTSLYWEVDPRDWARADGDNDSEHVDRVVAKVQRNIRDGSIVLSHDFNQATTVEAYATLLPWLKKRFELGLP